MPHVLDFWNELGPKTPNHMSRNWGGISLFVTNCPRSCLNLENERIAHTWPDLIVSKKCSRCEALHQAYNSTTICFLCGGRLDPLNYKRGSDVSNLLYLNSHELDVRT